MLTETQVLERMNGLGGSDIGAVVGLNKYRTAHDVYNEKIGIAEPFQGNIFTDFGNRLEPVLLDWYEENMAGSSIKGELVRQDSTSSPESHPKNDWMRGLTDGKVMRNGRIQRIVEAKTANFTQTHLWGEQGTDQVPRSYLVQCAWYMAICDAPCTDLVVLLGREFRHYHIERDHELESQLIDRGAKFWFDNVKAQVPPLPDGSAACMDRLRLEHSDVGEIEASEAMADYAAQLFGVNKAMAALEIEKKRLLSHMAHDLGDDAKKAVGEFGSVLWTSPKPKDVTDWERVALALNAPDDIIKEYTAPKVGKPSFRTYFKKGYEA